MKDKIFERKTELLEAALKEFSAKSYEEASLNTIIKQAGISKGTFYYHFHDKKELYLFLLESSVNAKLEYTNNWIRTHMKEYEGEDIFEKFRLQARIGAEFAEIQPLYHRLGGMFSKEKGSEIYPVAMEMLGGSTEKVLVEMINESLHRGEFSDDFSKDFILKVMSYLFSRFDEIFYTKDDSELKKTLANLDSFVYFLKNGLAKR